MQRNRLLLLAGAAAVAVIVVAVLVVTVGSGGGSGSGTTTTAASGGSKGPEAVSAFAGIPQSGDTLGKASAPSTLTVFEDPQCPYCRQWNVDTLPTVVANYVRTGKLKLQYRGVVVIGVNSVAGLRAIYGAAPQGKLWNMAEALYERQGDENSGWITVPVIKDAAKEVGANVTALLRHADSQQVTAQLNAANAAAKAVGLQGTPTFLVTRELGTPQQLNVAGLEPDQFTPALDAALQ